LALGHWPWGIGPRALSLAQKYYRMYVIFVAHGTMDKQITLGGE